MGSLSLIGPRASSKLTTLPFCVISINPAFAMLLATSCVADIRGRQLSGCTFLGASLGQQLEPDLRFCSNAKIASCSA